MDQESRWLLADKYGGKESDEFRQDILRLENGEPLAYVIGWTPFLHTKIYLDSHPLIPRPETEYWVSVAIKELQSKGIKNPKVLDLCAGSGCIGVAVLKAVPEATVHFAEIDTTHHETIEKNILANDITRTLTKIFNGDLFENITDKYDLILTNPPYIDPTLSDRVEASVTAHEPDVALWGGAGGMEVIDRIIVEAPKHLNSGGVLYIEHEPEKAGHIAKLCPGAQPHEDQFGVIRFSRIQF